MTDIVEALRKNSNCVSDVGCCEDIMLQAAHEIEHLREAMRYIWSHGDEDGKVPYSWGQQYAERFIKLAKQEWDRK